VEVGVGEPPRAITYHIDREGDWSSDGWPVDDPELRDALSKGLFVRDDGLFVRCEDEVHPVTFDVAPLFVRDVEVLSTADGGVESVRIVLHDGREEPLRASSLRVDASNRLFCDATDHALPALFFRPAYYRLMRHLHETDGRYFFDIGGQRCYVHTLSQEET